MPNTRFSFKQFSVDQDKCAMKVCTDACLFGASAALDLSPDIHSILDIGSGTGLLSLMLAQKSTALIESVEIDEDAAAQSFENFKASPWHDRLKVNRTGISQFEPGKYFDFIISNPPFFEGDLKASGEAANRARHDTSLTLKELLSQINRLLNKEYGTAAVLMPAHREASCCQIASEENLFVEKIIRVRQTPSHEPFRSMIWLGRKKTDDIKKNEITIKDPDGQYTPEFSGLLQDYYLYL